MAQRYVKIVEVEFLLTVKVMMSLFVALGLPQNCHP